MKILDKMLNWVQPESMEWDRNRDRRTASLGSDYFILILSICISISLDIIHKNAASHYVNVNLE